MLPRLGSHEPVSAVTGAAGYDVTGGMASKVSQMQALVRRRARAGGAHFSGETPGVVRDALLGTAAPGTLIS